MSQVTARSKSTSSSAKNDLYVAQIIGGFRLRWKLFAIVIALSWMLAAVYLALVPATYSATAQIFYMPRNQQMQSSSGALSRLGTLYGFHSEDQRKEIALATLKSNTLIREFLVQQKLLPMLFPSQWQNSSRKWRPGTNTSTLLAQGITKFKGLMNISSNDMTGAINVSLSIQDKALVAPLVNKYVETGDEMLRKRTLSQSESSLNYLEAQLEHTNVTELRSAIADLAEHQLQEITLAKNSGPFAFEFVDRASMPLRRSWPKPLLLFAISTFLSGILAAAISIIIDIKSSGFFG